jgi:hypothetical protein
MRSKYSAILLLAVIGLLVGCDSRKNLIGKWKVISVTVEKNRILTPSMVLVFDSEGYIMFDNGKAARGNWEMISSNNTLSLFLYGKALQHDLAIVGEYDFSSNKLTIADPKNEETIFLELERIEDEPTK